MAQTKGGVETDKLTAEKTRYGRDSAATSRTRRRLRKYHLKKYPLAEPRVASKFRKRKSKGIKVSGRWLKIKIKQTLRMFYGETLSKLQETGCTDYKEKFHCQPPKIQAFNRQVRKDVQSKRRRHGGHFDEKWGR